MKFRLLILVLFILFLTGCNQEKENIFPGDLPKIAANYVTKIGDLQKKLIATTDLQTGREISLQILKLKDDADLELKEYYNSNFSDKSIPFTAQTENELFRIQSMTIKNVRFNEIEISAEFVALSDNRNSLFLYLKFADKNGNEVPGWIAMISPKSLRKNGIYEFAGSYSGIENLNDVDLLLIKSREAFENKSSINH